jgi:hypothetical protein
MEEEKYQYSLANGRKRERLRWIFERNNVKIRKNISENNLIIYKELINNTRNYVVLRWDLKIKYPGDKNI